MSSEYATEQVPLTEIQEGDTIQDPMSGQWFWRDPNGGRHNECH